MSRPPVAKPAAKPAGRRRLDPKEREASILTAAIAFFAEQGFDGSTREFAARIGITQPLLYRYFPSKEALLDRVYREVYIDPWHKDWEEKLKDRTVSLEARLVRFYQDYARLILNYRWIRLFMFAGLKGLDFNARYLAFLRKAAFDHVVREIRHAAGVSTEAPVREEEVELVWGLHASIFYLGVRKFIYGMPIPKDVDADIALRVRAFLDGALATAASRAEAEAPEQERPKDPAKASAKTPTKTPAKPRVPAKAKARPSA